MKKAFVMITYQHIPYLLTQNIYSKFRNITKFKMVNTIFEFWESAYIFKNCYFYLILLLRYSAAQELKIFKDLFCDQCQNISFNAIS